MITEAIMDALYTLASSLFGWMGTNLPAPPTIWADVTDAISTLLGSISAPIRWFLPIEKSFQLAVLLIGLIVSAGFIRLGRRVVSLFTGGGGA